MRMALKVAPVNGFQQIQICSSEYFTTRGWKVRAGMKVELFHLNGTKCPEIKNGIWEHHFFYTPSFT
jgi:hypothetical protein